MPSARDLARSALAWGGLAGVTLLAVPPMLLGLPLVVVDRNRAYADRYLRALARSLVRLHPSWHVRVEGTRHLVFGEPFVLVVNHQSLFDLPVMCFLGHDTKYLGKASVFRVPVFGWALKVAGEVAVRRGDKRSGARALEELGRWLERGVSVAIFPEGTRTEDGSIGAFRMGAFKLAIDHQRPVVPIVIAGARDLLPKGSLVFKARADVRIRVLEPLPTAGLGHDDVAALAEEARARMLAAFAELEREPPARGARGQAKRANAP